MVKVDRICPWYLPWYSPMVYAHSICLRFSGKNNKIRFLESPSSLFKGLGARHLDLPELFIYFSFVENLARLVVVNPRDENPIGVIFLVDPSKIYDCASML